jgi:DNA-binding MarR family transcriptional regulator
MGGMNDLDAVAALATELRSVVGQIKRRLLAEVHPGEFTPSQVAVLSRLDRDGPATVTILARAEAVRPQSMGATVATLQAAGLIAGAADPHDGRQTLWSLTPSCVAMIAAGRAARQDWLVRAISTKLDLAEQAQLAAAAALLKRLVQP